MIWVSWHSIKQKALSMSSKVCSLVVLKLSPCPPMYAGSVNQARASAIDNPVFGSFTLDLKLVMFWWRSVLGCNVNSNEIYLFNVHAPLTPWQKKTNQPPWVVFHLGVRVDLVAGDLVEGSLVAVLPYRRPHHAAMAGHLGSLVCSSLSSWW